MPYIPQAGRDKLDQAIYELVTELNKYPISVRFVGPLNYVITKIIVSVWANCRSYSTGNGIICVLGCATREFARRHLDKYEDEKIKENGDIKPF